MREEGSGPHGSDPSFASEAEELRRRLYRPEGVSPAELRRYERLVADLYEPAPTSKPPLGDAGPEVAAEAMSTPWSGHRAAAPALRRRRAVILIVAAVFTCAGAAALLSALGPRPLPRTVPLPDAVGTTVLYHSRQSDPSSSKGASTYETPDYAIFDPEGRRVGVVLRCVGRGRVRIFAAARFDFRCSDEERVLRRSTPNAPQSPFTVYGLTQGNVVWSVRIVLL